MGIIISRFRKNKTTKEKLQGISKEITSIELFRLHTQQKQKTIVGRFVLFSVLLMILTGATLYFWALPDRTVDRLLYLVPFLFFPFVVVFLKRLITWHYARQINRNEAKLELLKEEKKRLLDEVMDKETYKAAKEILEQFAPEQLRKDNPQSMALQPRVSPQGQVARPNAPLQSPQLLNQELRRRTMTPLGPLANQQQQTPLRSMPGQPPYPNVPPRPGMMMPAGPPMARPVLPRDRGVMDKLVEFIVGDGPGNRFALICRQCASHNGMALQEEFEYLAFRCCYCFAWNPARKQRPPAPRLPQPSAPTEKDVESSPSSESEAEEAAKEGEAADDVEGETAPIVEEPVDSEGGEGVVEEKSAIGGEAEEAGASEEEPKVEPEEKSEQ